MWTQLPDNGIIIGPYGGIGFVQRNDLRQVEKVTCFTLFRWFKEFWFGR